MAYGPNFSFHKKKVKKKTKISIPIQKIKKANLQFQYKKLKNKLTIPIQKSEKQKLQFQYKKLKNKRYYRNTKN